MKQDSKLPSETTYFSAILTPHSSLSPKGFRLLMIGFGALSFFVGGWFYLIGAWPVLGFFGLDVVLLYLAFKSSYRNGRIYEKVELTPDELLITHHPIKGTAKKWQFNPYWVKLNCLERRGQCCLVEASSHGRRIIFASFLSDHEKRDFTKSLNEALSTLRTGSFPHGSRNGSPDDPLPC